MTKKKKDNGLSPQPLGFFFFNMADTPPSPLPKQEQTLFKFRVQGELMKPCASHQNCTPANEVWFRAGTPTHPHTHTPLPPKKKKEKTLSRQQQQQEQLVASHDPSGISREALFRRQTISFPKFLMMIEYIVRYNKTEHPHKLIFFMDLCGRGGSKS